MKKLVILLTMLTPLHNLYAEEKSNFIPLEVLFGNPEIAQIRLSPDGSKISYLKPDAHNKLQVWVANLDKTNATQVTQDGKRSIINHLWNHDSTSILYLQDKDGNENWHIYQTNINTQTTTNLTPFDDVKVRIIYYSKHHPDTMIIAMNKDNKEEHDLYSLNLKNKKITFLEKSPKNNRDWIVDHNLQVRFARISKSDGSVDLCEKKESQWIPIIHWEFEDEGNSEHLFFSKDNRYLYLLDSTNANTSQLVKFDTLNKAKSVLTFDPKYDIAERNGFIYDSDTYHIQAVKFAKDRGSWHILDTSIKDDFNAIAKVHHGDFSITSKTNDNSKWIIAFDQDTDPVSYYLYNREKKEATFLYTIKPKLLNYNLQPMHPISYTAQDGLLIHGYITYPEKKKSKMPLIVLVHGGPWCRDSWGYDPEAQWLTNRGYACLQINYRGSSGYGKNFLNAGNKEWGKKMLDDLVDGVQWAVKHCDIDPERVAISGASHGGYTALAAAAFTKDIFKCAIDLFGRSNVLSRFTGIPPYWQSYISIQKKRVGDPDNEQDLALMKSASPYYHPENISIPIFVAHGANDARIKQEESDKIVNILKEKNIPHQYLVFENEGHGFIHQENRFHCYKEIEKFLQKYL